MTNLTKKQEDYLPYFVMLDIIQESGGVNMFGAPAQLRELHPELNKRDSVDVVGEWMKSKVVSGS